MTLSERQKAGVILSFVSFLLLVALLAATDRYHWCAALVVVAAAVLVGTMLWGVAMAATSPNSGESTEFNFRRLVAAIRGARILSEKEIEEAGQSRNAIDLDDRDRIDKL
jgi:hypothetical protein